MKALEELWAKYENRFKNKPVLHEIFMRGYCYSEVSRRDVLVMGINPSFRQQECDAVKQCKSLRFKYDEVKLKDRYYRQIRNFVGRLDEQTEYMDVFNYRETTQKRLFAFLKDETGVQFLAENLLVTQLQMEQVVQPKLIVVKNKDAWMFFGKYAAENQYQSAVWMGYAMQKVTDTDCGEVYRIERLAESRQRVGYECLKTTHLTGTLVLFTKHYQYCKTAERPTAAIIEGLYDLTIKDKTYVDV